MLFGGHVSIANGISKAIERAEERGFDVIQFFASAPQSFKFNLPSNEEILKFKNLRSKSHIKEIYFHAIYLLNLASDRESLVQLSIKSLIDYLNFGAMLNVRGTIFHIGSYQKRSFKETEKQIINSIRTILDKTPKSQWLIMENSAGSGGKVGTSLEELASIYNKIKSDRLKICIDTEHLFASGVNTASYSDFANWLKSFDQQIGIANLVCLHANDSKSDLNSKVDRHENIGFGKIGKNGFINILKQPLLKDKPFILEVPGFGGGGPDKKNVEILRKLKS